MFTRSPNRQRNIRQIKAAAARALEKGQHKKALGFYVELEQIEPAEPDWSRQVGQCWRRLGEHDQATEANFRAAKSYANAGFTNKAVAMSQAVLNRAPVHSGAQELLDKLRGPSHPVPASRLSAAVNGASQIQIDDAHEVTLAIGVAALSKLRIGAAEAFVLSRLADGVMSIGELAAVCPIDGELVRGVVRRHLASGVIHVADGASAPARVPASDGPRRYARGTLGGHATAGRGGRGDGPVPVGPPALEIEGALRRRVKATLLGGNNPSRPGSRFRRG